MHAPFIQAKYEAEMLRLDEEYASLDVLWSKARRSMVWGLLAPLVWYGFGWGAAVVELLLAGALVLTRAYLIGVRKSENRATRELLERELEQQSRGLSGLGGSVWRPVHA